MCTECHSRTWAKCFQLGSVGGVPWVPGLRLDWSIQTKENRFLIISNGDGVLSKGNKRGKSWEAEETITRGLWGGSYQECVYCTSLKLQDSVEYE